MQSLESFYQSDLLPDLEKLEAQRLTVKKKLVQALVIFVALNWSFLYVPGLFGLNIHGVIWLTFIFFSVIITFFFWHIKYYREYHAGFKDKIIPRIVAFVDPRLRYDKMGMVPKAEFIASHLFNAKPGEYIGDDLVTGTLGETAIQFAEIHAKRVEIVRRSSSSSSTNRTKKTVTPIFRGLFFVADFNKSFTGTTLVLPDTAQRLFGDVGQALQGLNVQNGQLVKLEDPEFEKLFVVYGEDQVEARYILSTSLMRRLVDFQNRTKKEMRLSFSASKFYVAIPFQRELFEPKIRESLLNISHIKEYYDDLKLVVDLTDELNLNTRIWTQKGPVEATSVAATNAKLETGPSGTPPPPPPTYQQMGGRKRYSGEETKALFREFVDKADTAMAPKIKTAKRWLKRIAGIFLILLCIPFFIFETTMAASIILGFGLFFIVGGFMNPGVEKIAGSIIFTAIGILIALFSYNAYETSAESKDWPTVEGVIVTSEIEQQTSTSGEGSNKKTTVNSYPKIAYRYQVDGQDHESTKISFFSASGNANQIVSRYPKGKTIRVYYNPAKSQQAVLVPGGSGFPVVSFFFAGAFVALGLGIAAMLRKQTRALGNRC
jgi:energy-coupling factor transporter transmembrane protein EcfT